MLNFGASKPVVVVVGRGIRASDCGREKLRMDKRKRGYSLKNYFLCLLYCGMMPRGERSESIIINHENITRYEYQHKRNIKISTVDEKIPTLSAENLIY